jgi:hypothetical protein
MVASFCRSDLEFEATFVMRRMLLDHRRRTQ